MNIKTLKKGCSIIGWALILSLIICIIKIFDLVVGHYDWLILIFHSSLIFLWGAYSVISRRAKENKSLNLALFAYPLSVLLFATGFTILTAAFYIAVTEPLPNRNFMQNFINNIQDYTLLITLWIIGPFLAGYCGGMLGGLFSDFLKKCTQKERSL